MQNLEPHHLYVHVPFCRLVCAYCDFVTVGGRADDLPRYTDGLLAELAIRPAPGELWRRSHSRQTPAGARLRIGAACGRPA
jgi:coproporphyrinogen III oxidase-like Fe-S oxidoreductase